MKYISLLLIIGIFGFGGYYVFNNFAGDPMQASSTEESGTIGTLDAIEAAEEAARMLEGTQTVKEVVITEDQEEPMVSTNKNESMSEEMKSNTNTSISEGDTHSQQTMLVAGGCFWCVEADLEKLPGVIEVVSGYAEGANENPTYENYSKNGHREVAEVTFNPSVVSFEEILIYAMKHMDPTDADGMFADRGNYYSSAFYYENDAEKTIIENLIKEVDEKGPYDSPLAIEVIERPTFWPAEEYHQNYYNGTLSQLKYKYYRRASGRDDFIKKYWGSETLSLIHI